MLPQGNRDQKNVVVALKIGDLNVEFLNTIFLNVFAAMKRDENVLSVSKIELEHSTDWRPDYPYDYRLIVTADVVEGPRT